MVYQVLYHYQPQQWLEWLLSHGLHLYFFIALNCTCYSKNNVIFLLSVECRFQRYQGWPGLTKSNGDGTHLVIGTMSEGLMKSPLNGDERSEEYLGMQLWHGWVALDIRSYEYLWLSVSISFNNWTLPSALLVGRDFTQIPSGSSTE